MRRYVLAALLLFVSPVFADHASSIAVSPQLAGLGDVAYTLTVTNEAGDNISDVRIRIPAEFRGLVCGAAPAGWVLASSDQLECVYKTSSRYIAEGSAKEFTVSAVTSGDGEYIWEVRTSDVANSVMTHNPSTLVDGTAPGVKSDTLISPNGGENWTSWETREILWWPAHLEDANPADAPVRLEYTTDGKTWVLIAGAEENDGTYTWTVPDVASKKVRVRLVAADSLGNTATDASDGFFTIEKGLPRFRIELGRKASVDIDADGKSDFTAELAAIEGNAAVLLFQKLAATPAKTGTTAPAAAAPAPGLSHFELAVAVLLVAIIIYLLIHIYYLRNRMKRREK